MINQKRIITPHPLLPQFTEWGQTDLTDSINYYAVNSSLYAAEAYIKKRFDLRLFATNKVDAGRLLGAFGDSPLLPKTTYYTGTTFKTLPATLANIKPHIQNWSELSDLVVQWNEFPNNGANLQYTEYVDGYIVPSSPSAQIDEATSSRTASAPFVEVDEAYQYPFVTQATTLDVIVHGADGYGVFVDGEDSTKVVTGGTATITVDSSRPSTYSIALKAPTGAVSDPRNIMVVNGPVEQPYIVLIGQDIVTNGATCDITVFVNYSGTVNGLVVTEGLNQIALPVTTDVTQITYVANGITIEGPMVICKVDNTLPDAAVKSYNKVHGRAVEDANMPPDLLMAYFRVALAFFKEALGKTDDIERYSAGISKAITFNGHKISKDIIAILSTYMVYEW